MGMVISKSPVVTPHHHRHLARPTRPAHASRCRAHDQSRGCGSLGPPVGSHSPGDGSCSEGNCQDIICLISVWMNGCLSGYNLFSWKLSLQNFWHVFNLWMYQSWMSEILVGGWHQHPAAARCSGTLRHPAAPCGTLRQGDACSGTSNSSYKYYTWSKNPSSFALWGKTKKTNISFLANLRNVVIWGHEPQCSMWMILEVVAMFNDMGAPLKVEDKGVLLDPKSRTNLLLLSFKTSNLWGCRNYIMWLQI